MTEGTHERLRAAGLALVSLGAGVATRSGALAPFWAKYAGVALWCTLVYWLIVLAAPRLRPSIVFAVAVAIGWTVEVLQLTSGPARLASAIPLSRWVFGTTFHGPDLIAYVVGAAAGAALHTLLRRRTMGRPGLEPGTSRM